MTTYDSTPDTAVTTLNPPTEAPTAAGKLKAKALTTTRKTKNKTLVTVRRHPVPAAAGALTAIGATVGALIWRRRAARAKASRNTWLPGFLKR